MDASQILLPGLVTHMTRRHPGGRRRASPNTGHGMITVFPFATVSLNFAWVFFVPRSPSLSKSNCATQWCVGRPLVSVRGYQAGSLFSLLSKVCSSSSSLSVWRRRRRSTTSRRLARRLALGHGKPICLCPYICLSHSDHTAVLFLA